MSGGGEAWVRRWWRGEAGLTGLAVSAALLPAEWAFRVGAAMRNAVYDRAWTAVEVASIPVLSVGNLTVGGTGKTPLVGWFVGALRAGGAHPAVVARGYGRDELMLHRRWHPGAPVEGDPDRPAAVARAAAQGADTAVLDDGFQHRRLARDVDVVLLAAEIGFPGRRLPRGPYREGPSALARADLAIVTRKAASPERAAALAAEVARRHPGLPVARAALRPGGWAALDGSPAGPPAGPVLVLTAVADPAGVRALAARQLGRDPGSLEMVAYPDHHEFNDAEVRAAAGRGRALVVTEKDAVKLLGRRDALGGAPVHVLTLEVAWESGREHAEAAVKRLLTARAAAAP